MGWDRSVPLAKFSEADSIYKAEIPLQGSCEVQDCIPPRSAWDVAGLEHCSELAEPKSIRLWVKMRPKE